MAGLLDSIRALKFAPTPATMGLINAGAGMLMNAGPSLQPVGFGQSLGAGLQGFTGGYLNFAQQQAMAEKARQDQALINQRMQIAQAQLAQQQEQMNQFKQRQEALRGINLSDPDSFNKLMQAGDVASALQLYKARQAQDMARSIEERAVPDQFLNTNLGYVAANPKTRKVEPLMLGGKQLMNASIDPLLQQSISEAKSKGTQDMRIGTVTLPGGEKVPMRLGPAAEAYSAGTIPMGESTLSREQTRANIGIQKKAAEADIAIQKKLAEARPEKERGRQTVNTVLDEMSANYDELNKLKGIPSTEGSILENLAAGIGASELGQQAGKFMGTEEQSLRNKIQGSLPILMQSIMKATGMTATQLNSERELQAFMKAVTDPTTDIQAVKSQLDLLRRLYGIDRVVSEQQPVVPKQQNLSPRIQNVAPAQQNLSPRVPANQGIPQGWTQELEDEYQRLYGGGR